MKTYQSFNGRSLFALSLAAIALLFVLTNPLQAQNPSKESLTNTIQTKEQANALPTGSKVAMVCAKCKTVQLSEVDQKKGFLAWFSPKTKHLCPGCGGYWQYTTRSVKGLGPAPYVHTCSKCGSESAFCCSASGPKKTPGM